MKKEVKENSATTTTQTKSDKPEVKSEEKSADLAKPVNGNSPTSPVADEVTGLHFHTCCSLFCNYYVQLVSQL